MKHIIRILFAVALPAALLTQCAPAPSRAETASVGASSRAALNSLYSQNPKARQLGARAKGVLVFPEITKGGVMVGGMGGNGALFNNSGAIVDYYHTGGLSYGMQAGLQKYGYALFLMDDESIANINRANGWEIGSAPSLVVVDRGVSGSLSTTTINKGTYAFFFDQRGLMGGLGLQGSKITRIRSGR